MRAPLTFLFTDLENSTSLWEQFPELMRTALARHDGLLQAAVEGQTGRIVKTTGDGIHAVFESALDAIMAAISGQVAMTAESWPSELGSLLVRIGLHTGGGPGTRWGLLQSGTQPCLSNHVCCSWGTGAAFQCHGCSCQDYADPGNIAASSWRTLFA